MYTYPLCPEAPPPGPESDEAVDFQPPPPPPAPDRYVITTFLIPDTIFTVLVAPAVFETALAPDTIYGLVAPAPPPPPDTKIALMYFTPAGALKLQIRELLDEPVQSADGEDEVYKTLSYCAEALDVSDIAVCFFLTTGARTTIITDEISKITSNSAKVKPKTFCEICAFELRFFARRPPESIFFRIS